MFSKDVLNLSWRRGEDNIATLTYHRRSFGSGVPSRGRLWAIFCKILSFLEKIAILRPFGSRFAHFIEDFDFAYFERTQFLRFEN